MLKHLGTKNTRHFFENISTQAAITGSSFTKPPIRRLNNIPNEIAHKITLINRLRREWQHTRDLATKREINSKTTFIRLMLQTHKQDEWDKFSLNINVGSAYKLHRQLKKPPPYHPLIGPNGPLYSATERAKALTDKLQFSTNNSAPLFKVQDSINIINNSQIYTKNLAYTTPGSVAEVTYKTYNRYKNGRLSGEDTITNKTLKNLPKFADKKHFQRLYEFKQIQ